MAYLIPTVADFKSRFDRDFPYGEDMSVVRDVDIVRGFNSAQFNFNEIFFGSQDAYTEGWLLLAAHYMVMNLRASSQGVNGVYPWLEASKGVGSVNQSFAIPQRILDNPNFAMLTETRYGAKYLELILPSICGQVLWVAGRTHA